MGTADRQLTSQIRSNRIRHLVLHLTNHESESMENSVFKQVEITGTSQESISAAIESAVEKAAKSLRGMSWFEMTEVRGSIDDGEVQQYQATIKVGFKLDD